MTVVLKVGGASAGGAAAAVAELRAKGNAVCVVHGAGPQISDEMARRGLKVRFVSGRRVTTPEALAVVRESFRRVNATLCDEIGPDKDLTTVVQTVERRAGVEVRAPGQGAPVPK